MFAVSYHMTTQCCACAITKISFAMVLVSPLYNAYRALNLAMINVITNLYYSFYYRYHFFLLSYVDT